MHFQDSRLFPKSKKNQGIDLRQKLESKNQGSKFNLTLIKRLVSRWSIAKKIGYGYSLSIGIAIFGTTIGLGMGDYYQRKALVQQTIADRQQHLIAGLEKNVSNLRSHPQRLIPVLGQSIWLDYESSKFYGDVNQINRLLAEFESFINSHPDNLAVNVADYQKLLKNYKTNTKAYVHLTNLLWSELNPADLKPNSVAVAQQSLIKFLTSQKSAEVSVQFDRLTERLNKIEKAAEIQQIQAEKKLAQAETLKWQIMIGSMGCSVAIAVILAVITSRAIARPLIAVTQVAKAITQESNFDLRSPVTTQDEVGLLATSLNQLVQWVGEYTRELELARQTLEQRVEERTFALTEALQELQQTQTQLIQTEKMSSLGQMVAGIAHEINNPVTFISGNLQYANQYAQDLLNLIQLYQQECSEQTPLIQNRIKEIDLSFINEDLPKIIDSMQNGTDRIKKIIFSLRNFSRLDEAEMKQVDIHEGLENTLLILNHRLKLGIEVKKNYGNLPLVWCYPAQLNQVFMNILTNAIDVLEENHTSCLIANGKENFKSQQPTIWICTQSARDSVTVRIRDNGPGIPSEIKNKLFDPFFTTKPVGQGTGLGLSISYQIIEKHQGKIEVISNLGQGTEFAIALPIKTLSLKKGVGCGV